jgi:sugar/nucleoside kinase (ribokinase family)
MGEECKQNYRDCGVDISHVHTAGPGVPTGVAPITVDESGENVIVVVSGANMELTTEELGQAADDIASADVVVCQMEVPLEVNQKAMEMARAAGVLTVFNVAPCPVDGQLPGAIYAVTDVLCVNETELQTLAGVTAADGDLEGYKAAAQRCVLRPAARGVQWNRSPLPPIDACVQLLLGARDHLRFALYFVCLRVFTCALMSQAA